MGDLGANALGNDRGAPRQGTEHARLWARVCADHAAWREGEAAKPRGGQLRL
jgi:hypothetical protein